MTYTRYYLKFSSESEMASSFEDLGWVRTSPGFLDTEQSTYYSMRPELNGDIDIIGTIYNNDAVFDINEEGYPVVISEATSIDGWHVNLILEGKLPESLEEYALVPRNPHRIFA